MYAIIHEGNVISKITIREGTSGIGDRVVGDFSPVYDISYGGSPLLFEHIEQCYSLIAFLSLVGFEALCFDTKYMEYEG